MHRLHISPFLYWWLPGALSGRQTPTVNASALRVSGACSQVPYFLKQEVVTLCSRDTWRTEYVGQVKCENAVYKQNDRVVVLVGNAGVQQVLGH